MCVCVYCTGRVALYLAPCLIDGCSAQCRSICMCVCVCCTWRSSVLGAAFDWWVQRCGICTCVCARAPQYACVCLGACTEFAAAALQQICVCEHTHRRYSSSIAVPMCVCVHAQEWWQQRSSICVIVRMCVRSQSSATLLLPVSLLDESRLRVARRGWCQKLEKDRCLVGKNPPHYHAVDILLNIILLTANKAWRILSFFSFQPFYLSDIRVSGSVCLPVATTNKPRQCQSPTTRQAHSLLARHTDGEKKMCSFMSSIRAICCR